MDAAGRILWNPPKDKTEELRGIPWHALLLVKWALQHNGVNLRVGPSIPQEEFDHLRQQLWELQDSKSSNLENWNVWLMLRSVLHVQYEFQRKEGWGFLRWPALYSSLNSGSKSRGQFRDVMGMEPSAYIDLAYGLYAAVMRRDVSLSADFLSPFRPTYGGSIDKMYALFVRDLSGLRTELQGDGAQRIRGKQELFEFPYLRRFPLLQLRDGQLRCWHPIVFARGLEDAVHLRLSELGSDYAKPFSLVFEQYVTKLAGESGLPGMDETQYKQMVGEQASSVEAILEAENCNIFIEAKMSLFTDDVLIQDNETVIFNKTRQLRKAISQGWSVGEQLRNPKNGFGTRFSREQDFLLVVTSRELIIGGGEALQRLYAPGAFNYPDENASSRLPLTNVFILSIEDFENTMGCVAAGEVDLPVLLREAAIANQDAQSARMFFSDFLARHTTRRRIPSLLTDARDAARTRMTAAFGAGAK